MADVKSMLRSLADSLEAQSQQQLQRRRVGAEVPGGVLRGANLNFDIPTILCMLAVHTDENAHPHGEWGAFVRGHVSVEDHAVALFGARTAMHLVVDQIRRRGADVDNMGAVALFLRARCAEFGFPPLSPAAERICALAILKCAAVQAVKHAKRQARLSAEAAASVVSDKVDGGEGDN